MTTDERIANIEKDLEALCYGLNELARDHNIEWQNSDYGQWQERIRSRLVSDRLIELFSGTPSIRQRPKSGEG